MIVPLFVVGGVLLMALGLAHPLFPRYFGWDEECAKLGLLTREIHYVHNGFIGLFVFLHGVLLAFYARDLAQGSHLAKGLLLGLGVFWVVRLYCQLFVYSPELWRGKRLETAIHVLASAFWAYLAGILLWGWAASAG